MSSIHWGPRRRVVRVRVPRPRRRSAVAKDADVSGAWTWTQVRPDGEKVTVTLTLKQTGERLTGTFHGKGPDSDLSDGSVRGGEVRFATVREIDGHRVTLKYDGKLEGDVLRGHVARAGGVPREDGRLGSEARRGRQLIDPPLTLGVAISPVPARARGILCSWPTTPRL